MADAYIKDIDSAYVVDLDGSHLKISDRNEVNSLKEQVNNLNNRLANNEYLPMQVSGSIFGTTRNVLIHLNNGYAHIIGTVYTAFESDLIDDRNALVATISYPGIRFTNQNQFVSSMSTSSDGQKFKISANNNGQLEIRISNDASSGSISIAHPVSIDEYEQYVNI